MHQSSRLGLIEKAPYIIVNTMAVVAVWQNLQGGHKKLLFIGKKEKCPRLLVYSETDRPVNNWVAASSDPSYFLFKTSFQKIIWLQFLLLLFYVFSTFFFLHRLSSDGYFAKKTISKLNDNEKLEQALAHYLKPQSQRPNTWPNEKGTVWNLEQ